MMGLMSVTREFRDLGTVRGGELFLGPAQAVAMIKRAREVGVRILGVDGFWITPPTIKPDLGHILDLSSLGSDSPSSWAEATQFISERADLGLSFVVATDEDTSDTLAPQHGAPRSELPRASEREDSPGGVLRRSGGESELP
jgi:hypothetical protein